jgi:hypothetical protein
MTTHPGKFAFADSAIPSVAEIEARVRSDPSFPEGRRGQVLSSLSRLAAWSGAEPESMPFAPPIIRARLAELTPERIGRSKKRLQNVKSDMTFVMAHYGLGGRTKYLAPLTPEWVALRAQLETTYEVISLRRVMQFASAQGIPPQEFDDTAAGKFLTAMEVEEVIKDPRTTHKNMVRAWNRAVDRYEAWPKRRLTLPMYRQFWGKPWSAFPGALERHVDDFLQAGQSSSPEDLFSDSAPTKPLRPTTIRTQKEHLRMVATVVGAQKTVDLCCPSSFKCAVKALVDRHGVGVSPYIAQVAWTMTKLARHGGMLTDAEIKEVNGLFKKVLIRRNADARGRRDRDQEVLDALDDPVKMDALLTLPSRTAERVIKARRKGRREALEMQLAVALELWLCAPLRVTNFVNIDLDRHLARVFVSGKARSVLRVPGEDIKRGRAAETAEGVEHFLHEDAAGLLDLYAAEYLPLLLSGPTRWLIPGEKDRHKDPSPFRNQMRRFIKIGVGLQTFHPHLIRKIVTKICLDDDPGAVEVARRCLGHRDERATRKAYTQRQSRVAHERYLTALEGRRLSAFKSYGPPITGSST